MKVEIVKNNMVITIPMNEKGLVSKSGKSIVLASTNGNQKTNLEYEGQKVVVGVNAYIPKPVNS